MKKITFTALIFLFTLLGFSQGIAIQGIARDTNNAALANQNVTLSFVIYYIDSSNGGLASVFSETQTLTTDSFGAFSHVLDDSKLTNSAFSSNNLRLRISNGNSIISDGPFKRVPYAYSSGNGAPTGIIMPYIGATAPAGWLLCNGNAIPVNSSTTALRAMLGTTNTPDLRGAFLRGSGANGTNASYVGPGIATFQTDDNKAHLHGAGTLSAVEAGAHTHGFNYTGENWDHTGSTNAPFAGSNTQGSATTLGMIGTGDHSHTVQGDTGSTGSEMRPLNMAVNYIIKI